MPRFGPRLQLGWGGGTGGVMEGLEGRQNGGRQRRRRRAAMPLNGSGSTRQRRGRRLWQRRKFRPGQTHVSVHKSTDPGSRGGQVWTAPLTFIYCPLLLFLPHTEKLKCKKSHTHFGTVVFGRRPSSLPSLSSSSYKTLPMSCQSRRLREERTIEGAERERSDQAAQRRLLSIFLLH